MAKQSTALLGAFFADHPGPATREACVAALVERYRISGPRAHDWLDHALESGTLHATQAGISPRDLAPDEAVAHVLASHPAGLRWPEIAERIATEELCPEPVKRAPRKDARILRSAKGVFRHVRFASEPEAPEPEPEHEPESEAPAPAPPPEPEPAPASAPVRARTSTPTRRRAARSAPRTPARAAAPAPAPSESPRARELPIVRRRRDAPAEAAPQETEPALVLRSIGAAITGSSRAIEVQALHEHVKADTAIEISIDKLRSLLVTHAAELGWYLRGPFVSGRHIPWADLDEVLASAAKGHRRDPAELVARVRRLLRITNTTARTIQHKLQRHCS